MNEFFYSAATHWQSYLAVALAFVAAFGFLIFLRGFLSGSGHLVTIDHNAEYLDLARTRVVWGVLIMLTCFVLWELPWWLDLPLVAIILFEWWYTGEEEKKK